MSEGLGPLPQPVAWFRAPYGTLEPNPLFRVTGPQSLEWAVACFTEDQLRAAVAAERERCVPDVDELAQHIRWLNGSNKTGAGALAEKLVDWLRSRA